MKVNGIIAEYNPFHNGHQYHLMRSAALTGADYTIVVMSGDFVQRGAPALLGKHIRTEMALQSGADLVLELPVLYAASSAEYFAAGAAALLDKLGVVTHLCFGSECGDIRLLREIARLLSGESDHYRMLLQDSLKKGNSFPKARANALFCSLPSSHQSLLPADRKDLLSLLSCPNNTLGIEYIRALDKRQSPISPVTLKRSGAGYHDKLDEENCPDSGSPFCSAFAVRQALLQGRDPAELTSYLPEEAGKLFLEALKKNRPLYADAFSAVVYYKLLSERECGFEKYLDVTPDLSDRIAKKSASFTGFEAFCHLIKTKNITYTRIARCLVHILLDIRKEDMTLGKDLDYAPYARILGFRKSAAPLLAAVKAHSSVPLISKLAHREKIIPPDALRLLSLDIMAGEIYRGILHMGTCFAPPAECSLPPVIL